MLSATETLEVKVLDFDFFINCIIVALRESFDIKRTEASDYKKGKFTAKTTRENVIVKYSYLQNNMFLLTVVSSSFGLLGSRTNNQTNINNFLKTFEICYER